MSNLKRIRKAKNLTQVKLSEESGVNLQMISFYEQGVKDINKAQGIVLHKLAQALDCKIENLLETGIEYKEKLTDQELADIFSYCDKLSRLVAPNDAKRYYNFNFDGAVSDTLTGLAVLYDENGDIKEFKRDMLYGPTFKRMIKDIRRLLENGL